MAFKVTNKLFHNKQEFNRGDIFEPSEVDITPKQLANLVRLGTIVDEKHYDTYMKQQEAIAAKYAPRFVDKEEEIPEEYDPRKAAEDLPQGDEEEAKPAKGKVSKGQDAGDKGDFEPSTAEPKPNMSKAQLLEIARYRGVEADETATRDEIYKTLSEAAK